MKKSLLKATSTILPICFLSTVSQLLKINNPSITKEEAHSILEWVFGRISIKKENVSEKDQCFAEAMMVEMLDKSFAMGFIEALFRSLAKIPSGPKKVIIKFIKGVGKNLVTYEDRSDLKKMMRRPKVYKSVLATLARNFRAIWALREATGELNY